MTAAMASKTSGPTIALAIPPPASPVGLGSWVRKFQSRAEAPSRIRKYRTRKSGAMTSSAHTNNNPAIAPLLNLRQECCAAAGWM